MQRVNAAQRPGVPQVDPVVANQLAVQSVASSFQRPFQPAAQDAGSGGGFDANSYRFTMPPASRQSTGSRDFEGADVEDVRT